MIIIHWMLNDHSPFGSKNIITWGSLPPNTFLSCLEAMKFVRIRGKMELFFHISNLELSSLGHFFLLGASS
jgi:hypothetical protein